MDWGKLESDREKLRELAEGMNVCILLQRYMDEGTAYQLTDQIVKVLRDTRREFDKGWEAEMKKRRERR